MKRRKADEIQARAKDWPGFAQEFQDESDRAAAVLAAAWLDVRLQQLLASFFVDDRKAVAPLFDAPGPLDSFSARIRMGYSLGLLSRASFEDLVLIKDIRNAFAHDLHGLTFSDPQIAESCARLQTPERVLSFIQPRPQHQPRKLHEIAVSLLANVITDNAAVALQDRRRVPESDLLKGRQQAG